jgi:hypothetical protein
VQKAVGQDYVIMWRQKVVLRVDAARGLSGRRAARPRACDHSARHAESCRQLQGYHYQIVALQAAMQTLSGHLDWRPREVR